MRRSVPSLTVFGTRRGGLHGSLASSSSRCRRQRHSGRPPGGGQYHSAMRRTWARLGGQLGLGCIAVGLLVIGLAWNGAASVDFVSGQVPYLLWGGALGLGLIVVGAAMIIVQNSRRDRSLIEAQLKELNTAIARLANAVGGGGPGGQNGGGPKVVL